jgi:hypothetical protein
VVGLYTKIRNFANKGCRAASTAHLLPEILRKIKYVKKDFVERYKHSLKIMN